MTGFELLERFAPSFPSHHKRLSPKALLICTTAGTVLACALGFRDQLPPAIGDLVPSFSGVTTTLKLHSREAISRLKGSAPQSTETYWPGLPVSRNEKLVSLTRIGYSAGYATKVFSPLWVAYAIKSVEKPESLKRLDTFRSKRSLPQISPRRSRG